jgi:hypothetical protein
MAGGLTEYRRGGGAWAELGYRFSSFLYASLGAKKDSTGNLRPHFLLGPPVVMVCALVQIVAYMLNRLLPSQLSTIGYGVIATRKER